MARVLTNDLDYLTARLHGRRSRLAEAERLDALCRLPDLSELGRALYPGTELKVAVGLQRRLLQDLVWELSRCLRHLDGPGAELLAWMLVRFEVENLKVLVRGFASQTPPAMLREHLVALPPDLALDWSALASAESLERFVELLPVGTPRKSLREALGIYHDQPRPFFLEAALDRGYFQELLARTQRLSGEDRELIRPLVLQEVDAFHLMLAVRGRFHYGLAPALLLPLHVRGSGIPSERFSAMLSAADILTAASLAVGHAIDAASSGNEASATSATVEPAALEALAWKRFLRLANRSFRRSHLGLGAVVGYAAIRRVEVANLIALSEGMRIGVAGDAIRNRLIPCADLESAYV